MKPIIIFLLSLLQISYAQNVITQDRAKGNSDRIQNPFLSTTLSSKITYSDSSSSYLDFDSARKSIFSETLTHFLTKIFKDQQVYDLKIISVNIFDDYILKDGHYERTTQQHNKLMSGDVQHTLSFSTVISGEYTNENEINSIANESFRKMLVHVCDKFQGHLLKFMQDTGDPYFIDVESVVLGDFERVHVVAGLSSLGSASSNENGVLGMSEETLNTASIVAIVFGGIVFVALAFASVKYYRKEKQLKAARWRANEMASLNGGTLSFTKSPPSGLGHATHPVVLDDYSFDPLGASPGASNDNQYHGRVPPYTDYRDDPIHNNPSMNDEEIAFSSVWPESAPPTLFPAKATSAPPPKLSYSEELQKLPKQHVFAPPGKIGVAIDVFNGQPTVHKVRKGSPLENMLRANDVILSIDDVDTSCLSAADVTQLMVKRMDRVRKITFVRRA